jgi:hypothetical protein
MRTLKGFIVGALRALTLVMLAGVVAMPAGVAHAVQVLSVPEADQASDPVTVVDVSKLSSAQGHAPVVGARLQIVEASSGRVVYEWTTDGSTATINRSTYFNGDRVNLNLDTVYILREVSAPSGYSAAPDVRFQITGIYDSDVTIYDDANGHAYLTGAHHITLYDDSTTQPRYEEDIQYVHQPNQTVQRDREEQKQDEQTQTQSQTQKPNGNLSQTGDEGTLYLAAAVISAAGLCFIAIGIHRLRRQI